MTGKPYFLRPMGSSPLHGGEWKLTENLTLIDSQGERHVVPSGFQCDQQSLPDLARLAAWLLCVLIPLSWWLEWQEHWKCFAVTACISAFALWVAAIAHRLDCNELRAGATEHDYHYRIVRGSKIYADWILWQGMVAEGMPFWKCAIIYGGVLFCGWKAWADNGRKLIP